jgi:hypothetical protein
MDPAYFLGSLLFDDDCAIVELYMKCHPISMETRNKLFKDCDPSKLSTSERWFIKKHDEMLAAEKNSTTHKETCSDHP